MGDNDTPPIKNREAIAEKLAAVPIVTWDRFIIQHRDGKQVVDVYGWIDREDEYKDFVWVRFHEDGAMEYTTSSEEYTEYLTAKWFGKSETHAECRRVEDTFDIPNVVELREDVSLDGCVGDRS